VLAGAAGPSPALEANVLEASVTDGVYRVRFDALLDAPRLRVERVLTDFVGYAGLDPRIRASELAGTAPDGTPLLRTRIRACAGFFCRDIRRLERVTLGEGVLLAEAMPAQSDVSSSRARTQWSDHGAQTRVRYEAEFTPGFWVPAVVARRYAPRMLRDSVQQLFENVEERARAP
jgi:hypothetical protein